MTGDVAKASLDHHQRDYASLLPVHNWFAFANVHLYMHYLLDLYLTYTFVDYSTLMASTRHSAHSDHRLDVPEAVFDASQLRQPRKAAGTSSAGAATMTPTPFLDRPTSQPKHLLLAPKRYIIRVVDSC